MMWDNDRTLCFIKEFEKRPVLWRKTDKSYFNTEQKDQAWREIGEIFDEKVGVLKKKIDSLRGSRRREKHRILKRQLAGNEPYVTRWFAWDSLKFLDEWEGHTPPVSSPSELEETLRTSTFQANPEEITIKDEPVDLDEGTLDSYLSDQVVMTNEPGKRSDWKQESKQALVVIKPSRKRKFSEHIKDDECALFGAYIAEKLRKFDDKTRITLQHDIHGLLFQAEVKNLMVPPQMQCPDSSDSDHSFAPSPIPPSPKSTK
ncbi:uncharacterized protein LOC126747615 isoform X2 [Anthonomus grandis grandis]|uniref:uncharacterized protein LOC126747615 isoform X2 n=1 Tax=Anthonomus grandis grandis TaxID=2921223 RepID=UPI0021654174|nr:uncharacterized protein LOC126747615 isoform X2 [Anthonomus grandis grandis]